MTTHEKIKMFRVALGISQEELAKRVGYKGRSAISKVEKGERDISQKMMPKYARALGVPLTDLFSDDKTVEDIPNQAHTAECIELFQQLTDEQQKMIIASMKGIISGK